MRVDLTGRRGLQVEENDSEPLLCRWGAARVTFRHLLGGRHLVQGLAEQVDRFPRNEV
jgi:hypothetical protein